MIASCLAPSHMFRPLANSVHLYKHVIVIHFQITAMKKNKARFSLDSEASASESKENLALLVLMIRAGTNLQPHNSVLPVSKRSVLIKADEIIQKYRIEEVAI